MPGQQRGLQHVVGRHARASPTPCSRPACARPIALGQLQTRFLAVAARPAARAVRRASCARSCASSASSAAGSMSARLPPALRPHHQVQLRQRRFADLDGGVEALAVERAHQQGFDAVAHVGAEAVARDVDERRVETAVAVATQEQARCATRSCRPRMPMQVRNSSSVAGLEQLVARQRFQDVAQRLAAVAVAGQARTRASRIRGAGAPAGCPTDGGCRRWRCTGRGNAARRSARPLASKRSTPM